MKLWKKAREKDSTTKPSVKLNYKSMAKISDKDKQVVQVSLNNMFQLIGELLSESGNIEVNLGNLGKFSSINRSVIYSPMNPNKPSTLHGYQTVKGLMDLGKDANYSTGKHGQLDPLIHQTQEDEFEESKEYSKGHGQLSGSFKNKTLGAGTYPTRRFNKPRGNGKNYQYPTKCWR